MKKPEKIIVVTDLDGTLLDHNTYSFEAALPALQQLEKHNIPVIINSSKTKAEISGICTQLNNSHPFITENGSVIYTPRNYFLRQYDGDYRPFDEILLGTRREEIIRFLDTLPPTIKENFISFHECSTTDIVKLTGLPEQDAANALQRDYTEPLKWLGCDATKQELTQLAEEAGFNVLQGGRFLHIMGNTDKGKPTHILKQYYQDFYQAPVTVIALGDSHNDVAMLASADTAVVIRSQYHDAPEFSHAHKIISTAYGPQGWNECIQQLFSTNTK